MGYMESFSRNLIAKAEKLMEFQAFLIVESVEPHMIRYASKDFTEFFGVGKDRILNKSLKDIFIGVNCDLLSKTPFFFCEITNDKGKKFKVKLETEFADGLLPDVNVVILKVFFKDEENDFFNKIEERCELLKREFKHLDEEGQRWKLAAEGSRSGVWDWDAVSNVSFFSDEWKQMLGYEPSEITNNPNEWDGRIFGEDRDGVLKKLEDHVLGKTDYFSAVYRMIKKDGKVLWVQDKGKIVDRDSNGVPKRMVGIQTDISERIEIEKKLEIAKVQAEQASAIKGRFLANMTHELRTPLNGIIGMANILLSKTGNEEIHDNLKTILFSANSLLEIINEILDFSRIESGRMRIEYTCFDLKELLKKVEKSLAPLARGKGLYFSMKAEESDSFYVKGDPLRIQQILYNIIGNSIKFTEKGGVETKVSFEVSRDNGLKKMRVVVRDTGIGIPESKIGEIFDAYSQAEIFTSRKYGGTGLGLSITRSLVELMNGDINVESEEGKGTEFTVSIPVMFCEQIEKDKEYRSIKKYTETLKNKRILFADDNSINVKIFTAFIDDVGAEITTVSDGYSALAEIEKRKYDILLLDIEMPGMNGFETAEKIRASESGRDLLIIAVTAHDSSVESNCLENGFDGVIYKPFDKRKLIEEIERYFLTKENIFHRKNEISQALDGMDVEELKKLYGDFFIRAEEELEILKNSLEKRDYESLRRTAHSLKSSAGMIIGLKSADPIDKIEKISETGIRNPQIDGNRLKMISEYISKFESMYRDFKNSVLTDER